MKGDKVGDRQLSHDTMRWGVASISKAAPPLHPVERMQNAEGGRAMREFNRKLDSVRRIYGSGLAMRLQTEVREASSMRMRLPGMPQASNVGLETLLGRDETIDFEDFLGLPDDSPDFEINKHMECGHLDNSII